MGNKAASPFPSFQVAISKLEVDELSRIRIRFKYLCNGKVAIDQQTFSKVGSVHPYVMKYVLPRLFRVIDAKKDGLVDFEEFVSAVTLFRLGTMDDQLKVMFMMYESNKSRYIAIDSLRELLVESMFAARKDDAVPMNVTEKWIAEQKELSLGMAEIVLCMFASQEGRLHFHEFVTFAKAEENIQALITALMSVIDSE